MADGITTRETLSLLRRSLIFVWPYRRQVAVKVLLSFVALYLVLFLPWPVKVLIDTVVMGVPIADSPTPYPPYVSPFIDALEGLSPYEMLAAIATVSLIGIAIIGGTSGAGRDSASDQLAEGFDTATQSENQANVSGSSVGGMLGLFEYWYQLRVTHRMNHRLRSMLYARLVALPMTRFADASIGDAVYRVMYDTPSITRVCYDVLVLPVVSLFSIGIAIWTMQYSFADVPELIMIAWLAAPLMLLSTLVMTGITRRRSLASREAGADTTSTIEEGMSNIVAVQSLGANEQQKARFEEDSEQSFKRFRSYTVMTILVNALRYSVVIGLVYFVFIAVVEALVDNRMSPGDYGVLYTYFFQIAGGAAGLGAIWFNLQNNVAGMRRVYQILDARVDAESHGTIVPSEPLSQVSLEHVTFRYEDGTTAITDVSLEARRGEMIALVGSTGAGKSTFAYNIAGFVRPDEGRVLFDGHDIGELDAAYVRQQVSFVFQEPVIFDDSVTGNIAMGHPGADAATVRRAAETAGAAEFIDALSDGYATRLGRAGSTLSVGQKQRLAITRGLVDDAAVLILDEPTAALDPKTEQALVDTLQTEREARLLIVIAHRLSTIRTADRIVFLDEGRVLETGTHDELMRREGGAYRRFVELQSG